MTDRDCVRNFNFDKMFSLASEELEVEGLELTRAVMEMLPEGGTRRNARHAGHARPNTGQVDAGLIAKGKVRIEPRGLHGHRYVKKVVNKAKMDKSPRTFDLSKARFARHAL